MDDTSTIYLAHCAGKKYTNSHSSFNNNNNMQLSKYNACPSTFLRHQIH